MNRTAITIVIVIIAAVIAFYIGRSTAVEKPQTDFPGADKQEITKEEADKIIQNFRKNPVTPKIYGGSFQRAIIDKILAQPDCDGIRFFYAQENDSSSTLVLVGINSKGYDMTMGVFADKVPPCPPFCEPPH